MPWEIETDKTCINIIDEDGECVVSSLLHSYVEEAVEDHIATAQTEAAIKLILSSTDETEM